MKLTSNFTQKSTCAQYQDADAYFGIVILWLLKETIIFKCLNMLLHISPNFR